MTISPQIGVSFPRKDAPDKVHGRTRFADDFIVPGMLHTALVTSPLAHALINSIDDADARAVPGVRGVFSGRDFPDRVGLYLGDKPPLAVDRVLYFGEPVVAVVADDERTAQQAARLVRVHYTELPAVASPKDGIAPDAPILHPDMADYAHVPDILPQPGTNIAHHTKIRKGDIEAGFAEADVIVEESYGFPPADHAAMEPRIATAEIKADGRIVIRTSTQSPFGVRAIMSHCLGIPPGKLIIETAELGGRIRRESRNPAGASGLSSLEGSGRPSGPGGQYPGTGHGQFPRGPRPGSDGEDGCPKRRHHHRRPG
jgi:CO/xanthine dehydrogenase Mo-binding subunit